MIRLLSEYPPLLILFYILVYIIGISITIIILYAIFAKVGSWACNLDYKKDLKYKILKEIDDFAIRTGNTECVILKEEIENNFKWW